MQDFFLDNINLYKFVTFLLQFPRKYYIIGVDFRIENECL